jgi:hypothetical protein
MSKIKKFPSISIRKISGGKDPVNIVNEFILRLGHDPAECAKERDQDTARWMISMGGDEELEILAEGLRTPSETTIYMGVNIATVPLRGAYEVITAAMQIADGLVGIKISLVGHYLVLSSTMAAAGVSVEELDYNYRLIAAQQGWFRDALADELGLEGLPED